MQHTVLVDDYSLYLFSYDLKRWPRVQEIKETTRCLEKQIRIVENKSVFYISSTSRASTSHIGNV